MPAHPVEGAGHDLLLLAGVEMVVADRGSGRGGEEELRHRPSGLPGAEHRGRPARHAVQQPGVVQAEGVGHAEDRHVQAEVVPRTRAVREGQPADVRVQSVGPDHQVEHPRSGAGEGHVHAVGTLLQAGDRVAEQVLGAVPGRLVEDPAQVAAEDLHVAGEDLGRHRGHFPAVRVDVGGGAQAGLLVLDLVQEAHLGQHGQVSRAAEVHRVPAAAQLRGALHHGRPEPTAPQPVRQGGPGHARARDEDVLVLHAWDHTNV